jgi:hypothetical protein
MLVSEIIYTVYIKMLLNAEYIPLGLWYTYQKSLNKKLVSVGHHLAVLLNSSQFHVSAMHKIK